MKKISTLITLVTVLSVPTFSFASDSIWLEQARALTEPTALYAYDVDYDSDELRARASYDPRRAKGNRLTVIEPSADMRPGDFDKGVREFEAELDEGFWCNAMGKEIPEDAKLVEETGSTVTYTFKPENDDENASSTDKKFAEKLIGHITLDKNDGAVLGLRLTREGKFKPAAFITIRSFENIITCARTKPDGPTYIMSSETRVSGQAMFKDFKQYEIRKLSNLQLVEAE